MKKTFRLLVLCTVAVLTVAGCGGNSANIKKQQAWTDSLLNVAYRANDYKRLETLADSLQEAGLISDVKACYWLGYSNDKMMHKRLAEFYWTTGMASYIPAYDEDDTDVYAEIASRLAGLKCTLGEHEAALKVSQMMEEKERLKVQQWRTQLAVMAVLILALIIIVVRYMALKRAHEALKVAYDKECMENELRTFRNKSMEWKLKKANEELKVANNQLKETTAAKERMESELRIARDIQMSMVPHDFPDVKGLDMYALMTPAKEVGGDLYHHLLLSDKLYFCVGDVSGKGVPASLFMVRATGLFLTLAKQAMSPAEICTYMNDVLSEDNESNMFVTFWLGLVDLATGHLTFCNAGHNPPAIREKATGEGYQFLEMIPNAPIGVEPGMEYKNEEVETIKGRPIFIYTDGLNEAENKEKEQFGDERLLDILSNTQFSSAQQVIETLGAEVEAHRNGAEPNDDLTMMCLHIPL